MFNSVESMVIRDFRTNEDCGWADGGMGVGTGDSCQRLEILLEKILPLGSVDIHLNYGG